MTTTTTPTARTCRSCGVTKPADQFRDGVSVGRLPSYCVECRKADPRKAARQERNRARRKAAVERQQAYADRGLAQVMDYQATKYPDGVKVCPGEGDRASGCGQTLPLESFGQNKYQCDGLTVACLDCMNEKWASTMKMIARVG